MNLRIAETPRDDVPARPRHDSDGARTALPPRGNSAGESMPDPGPRPARPLEIEPLLGHVGWLRALARELVGEDDADDLSQDALLAAVRRPPDEPASLRAWLSSVL